ncbi:MAG TPA: nucleotide exchange factor GrpE [Puia sp.]|nr:nucleotide exchange factor GrpE [Puia sp.]
MQEKDVKSSGEEGIPNENVNGHESLVDINTDENMAGTTHLNNLIEDEDEVQALQDQLQEQKDKYIRLAAEFDNFRKRTAKERLELIQTAGKEVISSLLDVLDDCDRAEKQLQNSNDIDKIKEGVRLVFNKLRAALQNKGLKPMESIHTDFDVSKHEAITEIPAPTKDLKGKVIDEVTKGYYLNDKIIRFAKVIVGK